MKGNIYLICNPVNDTFKIGVTKRDVGMRLKELQTGNSNEVFVIDTFESKYPYRLEKMLHRHFFAKHVINEWFALDSKDARSFKKTCEKYESIINELESIDDFV